MNEDNISNQEQQGRWNQQKQGMQTSCMLAEQGDKMLMQGDKAHAPATKCHPMSDSFRIPPLPQSALQLFPVKTVVRSSTLNLAVP